MRYFRTASFVFFLLCTTDLIARAETQTIRISGSLETRWIYKENYDLRDGNHAAVVPVGGSVPSVPDGGVSSLILSNDSASWFTSAAQIEVGADLTDNVSVIVNLFNQRDWNSNQYLNTNYAGAGTSTATRANEFDLGIDLAYVTLKEAFYTPLTLTLGRQDIEFGRGFIVGDANNLDPQTNIVADELTVMTSFDAARATLDFEPWTLDFVYLNTVQGDVNDGDSSGFLWMNVNYRFEEYSAEWEAYSGAQMDGATGDNPTAAAENRDNATYVAGSRVQFDPVSNMTVGGEGAYQWGQQSDASTAAATDSQFGKDREAWMFDIFGEYRWSEHAYKPWVGLEYVFASGDDPATTGAFEGWNGLYNSQTFGVIHNELEGFYQTALSGDAGGFSNLQTFFVSAGFVPMDDLQIDGQFYWFWSDEDILNSSHGGSQNVGRDLGTELDLNVTYDYTEDVVFTLGLDWFFPGDVYSDALVTAAGANGAGEADATAFQTVTGVSVTF